VGWTTIQNWTFPWRSWPHLTWFRRGSGPKQHRYGSAIFAEHIRVTNTDRHTDRQTTLGVTSVAVGHIYAMQVMQPKNASCAPVEYVHLVKCIRSWRMDIMWLWTLAYDLNLESWPRVDQIFRSEVIHLVQELLSRHRLTHTGTKDWLLWWTTKLSTTVYSKEDDRFSLLIAGFKYIRNKKYKYTVNE